MGDVRIVEYKNEYAEEISDIVIRNLREINIKDYGKEAIEKMVSDFEPEKLKQTLAERSKVYVAKVENEIVGTAGIDKSWYEPDGEYWVLTVFVKPEYHGKGIGKILISKIEEYAKEIGAKKLVIPASITANEFYHKLGYLYKNNKKELNSDNMYIMEKVFYPEEVKIRNIKFEDIEQVVDIQVRGWQSAYRGIIDDEYLNSMNKDERIVKRQVDYKDGGFIVAELDNEIVGFCRYVDDNRFSKEYNGIDSELCALYVKTEYKRKGIGRLMLEYVINNLKTKEKSKMILWCLKENYSSRKFYEKMGGRLFSERKIEIGNKLYDEVAYKYEI